MAHDRQAGATTGRVSSTGWARGYWLLLGVICPTAGIAILVSGSDGPGRALGAGLAAVGLAVLALLVAQLGRHVRPLPDGSGLAVRSAFRHHRVPWPSVLEVTSTEFESGARWFSFSKVIVRFEDGTGLRQVTVGLSFRSGSTKAFEVRTWAPLGHPVRQELPSQWRDATELPADLGRPAPIDDLDDAAGMTVIGPDAVYRVFVTGCLGAVTAVFAAGVVVGIADGSARGAANASLSGVLAVLPGWGAVRSWRARVELRPTRLISRGVLGTKVYRAADIQGFEATRSGLGHVVRIQVVGRGSRGLAVGACYGGYAARLVPTLDAWLAQSRHARPAVKASSRP